MALHKFQPSDFKELSGSKQLAALETLHMNLVLGNVNEPGATVCVLFTDLPGGESDFGQRSRCRCIGGEVLLKVDRCIPSLDRNK